MMNIEKIREICLAKPLVTEDTPFGPEFVAFRFFDKIFCCIDLERPHLVTMKCDPDRAVSLRDAYPEITGAWHWNKRMWNDVRLDGQVPDALIVDLIDHAYDEVRKKLPKKTLYHFPDLPQGWTHTHLPEVDSTMNVVRAYPPLPDTSAEAGPTVEPTRFELLTADFQTAGRGQRGSHWEADDRQNLLLSFRFCPSPLIQPCHHFMLSECLALAVAKALKQYGGNDIRIKWPNDIHYKDRKIAGMLLEHDLCQKRITQTLVGVGINVNQRQFVSDAPNPVSLYQILGKEVDRAAILRNVLTYFTRAYTSLYEGFADLVERDYHKLLYRRNGYYTFADANGTFRACIVQVHRDGLLELKDEGGHFRTYAFKEVSFVL